MESDDRPKDRPQDPVGQVADLPATNLEGSAPSAPFLSVQSLGKTYSGRRWWARTRNTTAVLHDVSFHLAKGRTLGLVGPSGSGKSTLARCLALFEPPTQGTVHLEGRNLWTSSRPERRTLRAQIQLIFQEPAASLNPRFTAGQIVEEPLVIQRRGTSTTRRQRASELMETVGLPPEAIDKPALHFSGGERQRLAIARALALEPKLLILDESFSGLDLSVQTQVANLLSDLQTRLGLTYILISHDLAAVASLAQEIAVMDAGRIVEHAPTAELLASPRHPRTRELVEASLALSLGGVLG
jgi:peptide/nickel transport system ATP-binding protein